MYMVVLLQPQEITDPAINRMEKSLGNHHNKVVNDKGKALRTWPIPHFQKTIIYNLTFNGLRYNYIQELV